MTDQVGKVEVDLVGIGRHLSLQDLIDLAKENFPNTDLDEIEVDLRDLGISLGPYDDSEWSL